MNCSNCGFQNRPGVRFCEQCGNQMSQADATGRFCPNCGGPIRSTARFCDSCGAPIDELILAPKDKSSIGRVFRNALFGFIIAFALIYGAISAVNWILPTPAGNLIPFLGLQSAQAGVIAQNYVDSYFPDFSLAERTVFPAYVDGHPVYIVDFISKNLSRGLRVLVSRDLGAVWVYQMAEGN